MRCDQTESCSLLARVASAAALCCAPACLDRFNESCGEPVEGGTIVRHASMARPYLEQLSFSWTFDVPASDPDRVLLVVCDSDAASAHPDAVVVDGTLIPRVMAQDAPSYGALSVWQLVDPPTGGCLIEVRYPAAMSGLARSIAFAGVDQATPLTSFVGSAHGGTGAHTATVASAPGDLAMMLVSWGNDQNTEWQNGETEVWDDIDPSAGSGGSALGSAAAVLPGAARVDFSWDSRPDDGVSGAHIGFSIRAASR